MASVLYDLRMICWPFCLAEVRSGVGVVKNLELGVILAEGKSYLFSQSGTKYGGCSEKTRCHKEKGTRR